MEGYYIEWMTSKPGINKALLLVRACSASKCRAARRCSCSYVGTSCLPLHTGSLSVVDVVVGGVACSRQVFGAAEWAHQDQSDAQLSVRLP